MCYRKKLALSSIVALLLVTFITVRNRLNLRFCPTPKHERMVSGSMVNGEVHSEVNLKDFESKLIISFVLFTVQSMGLKC